MEQNHFHPSKQSDELVLNALFNPETPLDPPSPSGASEEETVCPVSSPEVVKAKALELEAVTAAEQGELDKSLQLINLSIDLTPDPASLYNNRAQIYRLMGRTQDALSDLDTAIDLSGGVGKSAVMAYTQRGLLLKLQGDDDKAWNDFKKAADLGGVFAKSILVQTNPMAALCNRMLKEAVGNLYSDSK
ncbi:Tetratricopeptide repeat protein 36-like [Oopsacas minuta]|uniref:Tetratricopeptide repeat protein 36-like n=1 Tax=Oopsacas minuta TaxID=111878 RepID=A0AAV7JFI2_9METZ|nr:Tetratricopeptide repeat protein 36-like [Oopsacas minuta]